MLAAAVAPTIQTVCHAEVFHPTLTHLRSLFESLPDLTRSSLADWPETSRVSSLSAACCSAAASQSTTRAIKQPISGADLGSKSIPFVQPGCTLMFLPGQACTPRPSPSVKGCCTPGHTCAKNPKSNTGRSCRPVAKHQLQYSFEQQVKGSCRLRVDVGGQCGGAGFECFKLQTCDQFGPWVQACCPNGYSCQPKGADFRLWTCQVNMQDQAPGETQHQQYKQRQQRQQLSTCQHMANSCLKLDSVGVTMMPGTLHCT